MTHEQHADSRPAAALSGPERSPRERLIVALDRPDLDRALAIVDHLDDRVRFYKVGLTLYTAAGHAAVEALVERGKRVFLDLKLHDIPVQVAGAVTAARGLGATLLTLHTAGGAAMLEAAAEAARGSDLALLGVTVLTSQTAEPGEVERRARLAVASGLDGVVCSPLEVATLRAALGHEPLVVTPGIRPARAAVADEDQVRVATPEAALAAGASHLVVGRPITGAAEPRDAADAILAAMRDGPSSVG
jgi:orotidine-5'-phosphate decarboxylase